MQNGPGWAQMPFSCDVGCDPWACGCQGSGWGKVGLSREVATHCWGRKGLEAAMGPEELDLLVAGVLENKEPLLGRGI